MAGFFSTLSAIFDVGSSAVSIYNQFKTAELAEDRAEAQASEARRQRDLEIAAAKRTARIQNARLLASQAAAGVRTSTITGQTTGLQSSLEADITGLEEATSAQIEQFNIAADVTKAEAFTSGIAAAAQTAAGIKTNQQTFTEVLGID